MPLSSYYDYTMTRIKILAWNQQGYGGLTNKSTFIRSKMSKGEYDIICLQEAGQVLNSFNYCGSKRIGRYNTRSSKIIDKYKPQRRSKERGLLSRYEAYSIQYGRCSLVTYVKQNGDFTIDSINLIPYHSARYKNPRFALTITIKGSISQVTIANVHLCAKNQSKARRQMDTYIEQLKNKGNFCMIGDYNIDKGLLTDKDGIQTYSQEHSTQISGRNLDYMRTNINGKEEPIVSMIEEPGKLSDHAIMEYEIVV